MIKKPETDSQSKLTVFDGWPLAYDPFSPAGLHLLTLLDGPPEDGRRLVLLPAPSRAALPANSEVLVYPTTSTPTGRLAWEQVHLPRQAARHRASALVLTRPTPPVGGTVPSIYWPAGEEHTPNGRRSLVERLRLALAAGGQSALQQLMWPADLPVPRTGAKIKIQPPRVHPIFYENSPLRGQEEPVPTSYVLYTGPHDARNLRLLLAGWSWAAPSFGDDTQLILRCLPHELEHLLIEHMLSASVRTTQPDTLTSLAALYRQAAAVVHLGPACPWGDPVAAALASGQALIAMDEPLTAARCGPAAYLVPSEDPRVLGAALITLIVEENVNGQLREAARKRVQGWALNLPAVPDMGPGSGNGGEAGSQEPQQPENRADDR